MFLVFIFILTRLIFLLFIMGLTVDGIVEMAADGVDMQYYAALRVFYPQTPKAVANVHIIPSSKNPRVTVVVYPSCR